MPSNAPQVLQPLLDKCTVLQEIQLTNRHNKYEFNIFIVPFGEWEKNPRLSGEDFSRPAGPES